MNLEKLMDLENVSLDMDAVHPVTGEKAADVFCTGWPATKKGLELTQSIVKNVIVRAVIGIVIVLGDGISAKICPA